MFKESLDNTPCIFRSAVPSEDLTWEDVYVSITERMYMPIEIIDGETGNKKFISDREDTDSILREIFKGNPFVILGFMGANTNTFEFAKNIEKHYNVECDLHVYGGLEKRKFGSFPKHSDPSANFICQFDGVTNWKVYDDEDNIVIDTKLLPGDVLYIPFEAYHLAEPEGKRLSVSVAMWKK